ncbi:MAG: hypothetical protein K9G49_14040 [Taibaiella sp.]|nr:hypothetical protein [Taibaiella sp.]
MQSPYVPAANGGKNKISSNEYGIIVAKECINNIARRACYARLTELCAHALNELGYMYPDFSTIVSVRSKNKEMLENK